MPPHPPLLDLPLGLRLLRGAEFPRKLGICDRLFGRRLASHGIRWVRSAPGPAWKLDLANPTHRWIVYGSYEGPGFWRWLRRQSGIRTIVDSGANIGQTVLYFSARLPDARILAFEPGSEARAWLAECVAANGLGKVEVQDAGLGAAAGSALLATAGAADRHGAWNQVVEKGGAACPQDAGLGVARGTDVTGEPIRLTTLDAELDSRAIETLDLWKLDMEGYELHALRGAASALAQRRIRFVYVEADGDAGREALAFLAERGYRAHGLDDAGRLIAWAPSDAYASALCFHG